MYNSCIFVLFKVYKALSDANISYLHINGLEECFKQHKHPFMGLETHYQQMQYYKNNLNLIVSFS